MEIQDKYAVGMWCGVRREMAEQAVAGARRGRSCAHAGREDRERSASVSEVADSGEKPDYGLPLPRPLPLA